jgi:hypothetical protein
MQSERGLRARLQCASASVRPSTVSRSKVHWSNVRVIPFLRRCECECALLLYCPPYIYIYDCLSIGASGCNRLKGHIYICVCAFFLHRYIFTPLTLTYPHEARAGQVFYGEKRMSKNMTWPFRAYLPVLAPALMLLLPTAPAPLTSTQLNNS